MSNNTNLHDAKTAKNDEFYTNISDIEKELKHYKEHFKGKTVLCNCDDPFESNFFKYFVLNFNELGLKKLICTCYAGSPIAGQQLSLFDFIEPHEDGKRNRPYKAVVTTVHDTTGDGGFDLDDVINLFKSGENTLEELNGDGDFRSEECLALLDECDICCTNEPFSLFREFIAMLVSHNKKFLIIGNKNAITYKETFPLLKDNKMWLGYTSPASFVTPNGEAKNMNGLTRWFTNLDIKKRHEKLVLWQKYYDDNGNPLPDVDERYPHYDNYDAIEVGKVADIPCDYYGVMGVPITYLDVHNPDEFDIVGMAHGDAGVELGLKPYDRSLKKKNKGLRDGDLYYMKDGNPILPYRRILIRKRAQE